MAHLFCHSCGTKIEYAHAQPNFCVKCGQALNSTASVKRPEPEIKTEEAKKRAKRLAREHGLLVGISAGANVLASEKWIEQNNPKGIVVTILCDRGERYLSCL